MRLTIFWRVIFAQISLIILILGVSLYARSQLNELTLLSTDILARDSACIEEEKQLRKIFFAQMRSAEKYLLLRDRVFYSHFMQGTRDFESTLARVVALIDSPKERDLIEQVKDLHAQYGAGLASVSTRQRAWEEDKDEISDGIITRLNELLRLREKALAQKQTAARDRAAFAARVVTWLTLGSISAAVLLAYLHARGISRPLRRLARELRFVGRGSFSRSLEVSAPKEVGDLTRAFNWMAHRLTELDQMKADFIAHVSHELRTPLTAIREGTALLLEEVPGSVTGAQREILDVVQNHCERLYHSISSLLDLSKMEVGMMEYTRAPSDLAPLIERSVETVGLIAQRKRIRIEVSCPTPLPLLSLDAGRIQQVLDNLLSNAVKFTPATGAITIAVSHQRDTGQPEGWVEVRVSDTGVGIQEEDTERIFDKFYQSSQPQGESRQGTGLGLAIARHIVLAHGGRIWVESQVGKGSTFMFTLPVTRAGEEAERKDACPGQPEAEDAA